MAINYFRLFLGILLITLITAFVGCGGGDGGLSDWQKPGSITVVSNLRGQVLPPVAGASSSVRPAFSLLSIDNTEVYLEERPDIRTTVASNGVFLFSAVPAGKYHVVAQKLAGTTSYRQRSDLIDLSGKYETQEMPSAMPLVVAPYKIKMKIEDLKSGLPVPGAKLKVWGQEFMVSATGDVEAGPLPHGFWPVRIEAAGYQSVLFHAGFQDQRRALLHVKLTPVAATDKNRAPFVEIEQGLISVRANDSVNLQAVGFDPDGDQIAYSWATTRGTFFSSTGPSVVFTAPVSSGTAEITVIAKDSKGAEAKAILRLDILPGSLIPPNPNNKAPLAAANPFPENLSENLGIDIVLRWTGSDPDGDALTYDVLLATQGADLKLVAQNISDTSFRVAGLTPNQTYFWQVVSRDIYEAISPLPMTWQFKTGDANNSSPYQPKNPVPDDLAFDQLPTLQFSWTGGDPDINDILTYSFLFGEDAAFLELKGTTNTPSFSMEELKLGTTYYWQVIAADNRGRETRGPIWRFSTYAQPNSAPENPVVIYPASGATGLPLDVQLRWSASDPDGDALTYDVFVGASFPLQKLGTNLVTPTFIKPMGYQHLTKYYWQVVVKDSRGLTNADSPIWSFNTADKTNLPPSVPVAQSPADNAINVALKPVFTWSGGDPDGDNVVYDFYLDQNILPVDQKASGLTVTNWTPASDLLEGTRYYWRVIGKDPAGASTSSQIYSFFTRSGADLQPPSIVSVSPADGAVDVSQGSELRVIFSETVNKNTASQALSLSPSVSGSWTWENDSTIRFYPSIPWRPGSYNTLKVAANTVRDLNNNLMVEGARYSFTVATPYKIPQNHRSNGFPIAALNGQTVDVVVPELGSGNKSFVLAVASPNAAVVNVQGSVVAGYAVKDPSSAFREFERSVGNRDFPAIMTNSGISVQASMMPMAAPQIGVSESFYIPSYGSVATSTAFPNNVIQATCLGLNGETAIYADNSIVSPSMDLITEVRKRFDEVIRPRINDVFGAEPALGPDGDPRVTILLTDSLADGIAGIFYGADLFARDPGDIQLRESNARKMFYIKYSLASDITRFGTLAHEFQHMVNFWQKRLVGGSGFFEDTWLNEGLSKYAEEVCGYGILEGDQNTALLIELSQNNFPSLSVTNWQGLNSYGLVYLFVRYLAQENRYGTTYRDVTRQLVQSALKGKANVEAITGESFSITLGRWGASLYINDYTSTSPQEYGLKGLNLAGVYNGVTLPGFRPVGVNTGATIPLSLAADQLRCFEKTSFGAAETSLSFSLTSGNMHFWTWDQRP